MFIDIMMNSHQFDLIHGLMLSFRAFISCFKLDTIAFFYIIIDSLCSNWLF